MREAFEKVQKTYEAVKTSIQEKLKEFKQKFEGTKSEMAQEVTDAKSPEDLIAAGKKLQEQGEILKAENAGIEEEEASEEGKYEAGKKEMIGIDHDEANEMNESFDENRAAETAAAEESIRVAEELKIAKAEEERVTGLAEARAKLGSSSENVESVQAQEIRSQDKMWKIAEDVYGMDMDIFDKLMKSEGYPDKKLDPSSPTFENDNKRFIEGQKDFAKLRVTLFDRVLSGAASEEEIKIAEKFAEERAKRANLHGYGGTVPMAWLSNERLAKVIAEAKPGNREFVDDMLKKYTPEQLKTQRDLIGKNGHLATTYFTPNEQ